MKRSLLFSFLLVCVTAAAWSQQQAISGKVTGEDGAPLPGVSVMVKGTSIGTQTDLDGNYEISATGENQTLVFSYIGFVTVEEAINGRSVINVQLGQDIEALSEVVVTALGISKEKKALGYSATSVDAEEITRTSPVSMLDGLRGKIAGANISSMSGSPGASTKVILRGYSSLKGSNQPLYVIDGIPVDNGRFGSGDLEFNRSLDFGNNANDINPANIASISILKGAGATSLYGSRAANGVILITTKKGQAGAMKVDFNSTAIFSSVLYTPELQNEFGQGWSGHFAFEENGSWGPRMNGEIRKWGNVVDNTQLIKPFAPQENNVLDFYDTGKEFNNSIAVSGGNENSTYYFSYGNVTSNGIIPTKSDSYDRNTFSLKGSTRYKDFNISAALNYVNRKAAAVSTGQGTSTGATMFQELIQIPRDHSIVDSRDYKAKFYDIDTYFTPYAQNPYLVLNENGNDFNSNRIYGRLNLDYQFNSWMSATARIGTDITDASLKDWQAISDPSTGSPNDSRQGDVGGLKEESTYRREFNSDVMLNFNAPVSSDISFDGLVGWNYNQRNYRRLTSTIEGLTIPGFYELSNSPSPPVSTTTYTKRRLIGVYAQANFSYRNFLYLSLNARNDWSSTLPINANDFFYPGANMSFVLTDAFEGLNNGPLTFAKLRASWGMTGNDADPYLVHSVLVPGNVLLGFGNITFPFGGISAFEISNQIGNLSLQPEITREYEFGADFRFFDNRIGIDIAYYNMLTTDQILPVPVAATSGYTTLVTNFGEVENKGIELALNLTPVKTPDFTWDATYTFSRNRNKVLELPNGLDQVVLNSGYDIDYVAIEGMPLGVYKGPAVAKDPQGRTIVNSENGIPVMATDKEIYGDSQQDFAMGLFNQFNYKNWGLGFSFDYRKGGLFWSYTAQLTHFVGNAQNTLYNDRQPFIIPNSSMVLTDEDGDPILDDEDNLQYVENTKPIDQGHINSYYATGENPTIEPNFLLDRSFLKLRDVTLTYTFPQSVASRINAGSISLSAIGRNLFVWLPAENTFIDPEVSTFSNDLTGQFGEFAGGPTTRSYGLSLKVTF